MTKQNIIHHELITVSQHTQSYIPSSKLELFRTMFQFEHFIMQKTFLLVVYSNNIFDTDCDYGLFK